MARRREFAFFGGKFLLRRNAHTRPTATTAHHLQIALKKRIFVSQMLTLEPASPKDFATIEQLAREIWTQHYVPIIGRPQVDYMLNKLYSAPSLQKQTRDGQEFHLIRNGSGTIGFVSVSKTSAKDYFLHKFYLLPQKQNAGLGAEIFKKIFSEMYQPESIRLTVNRQNYKSVNFYFKLGFKIEKVEDFDIGDGYFMNDFVMLWKKN